MNDVVNSVTAKVCLWWLLVTHYCRQNICYYDKFACTDNVLSLLV